MAILKLHNYLNPQIIAPVDSAEVAAVDAYYDGSLILLKGGSYIKVHESSEEIYKLLIQ